MIDSRTMRFASLSHYTMLKHFPRIRWSTGISLLFIAAVGLLLGFQGWKSRFPWTDMLPYVDGAERLIVYGKIPYSGVLTSFASYTPPGLSWFWAPGMLVITDPRLFDAVGRVALHLLTLVGIFLLARTYLEEGSAVFATALYGFSQIALRLTSFLYDRIVLQFFYVWLVYWIVQWVRRNNTNYLAAALVTYAAGIYTFPEMAPAVFILPGIWLLYRPPVKALPLLITGALALGIWYPYIRFESGRNFADVKAIVARKSILPADYKNSWCDPSLVASDLRYSGTSKVQESSISVGGGRGARLAGVLNIAERLSTVESFLPSFENIARLPALGSAFFWLTLAGIFVVSRSQTSPETHAGRKEFWRKSLNWLGLAMILLALTANEIVAQLMSSDGFLEPQTRWLIREKQILVGLAGLLIYNRRRLASVLSQLVAFRRMEHTQKAPDSRVLALSFVVPWSILFLLVSNDRFDRFWWLWPIQVVLLAALIEHFRWQFGAPKVLTWLAQGLLLAAVAANPLLLSRMDSWIHLGWSGSDPDELKVIDYVAADMRAQSRKGAAIGYAIYQARFASYFNIADSRYKVGSSLDFVLSHRHHMTNTDRCAEGFFGGDDYRIVQSQPQSDDDLTSVTNFAVPLDNFEFLQRFGLYDVLRRRR